MSMKKFYVITNEAKDPEWETTRRIRNCLMKRNKICLTPEDTETCEDGSRKIPADVDCIIVLGGDGTLLRAARNLVNLQVPLLGINLGTLGYLTEGDRNSIPDIMERISADEYFIEERMMLYGRVLSPSGAVLGENVALNDLTVNRQRMLRVFDFKLYVNGKFLYMYKADGIVISTPTGSTAYNLSCGGPIVEPTAKLFLVTPIAPHSLNNRSLILSSTDAIELEILGSEKDLASEVEYVTFFDGDAAIPMEPGCRIEISRAPQVTRIVKLSSQSFLETLRIKMS